ncbi:MAG: hypothetical protein GEV03_14020 [Streptosporangiales bacterium]|nr:hypothetical protein [Streptosporangiales bacterium]
MNREELRRDMYSHPPGPDEVVYIERRGDEYTWRRVRSRAGTSSDGGLPDAWMYYSGGWPREDPERWDAFFDDLLAELDAMTGAGDRCRWPLDDPWPHLH